MTHRNRNQFEDEGDRQVRALGIFMRRKFKKASFGEVAALCTNVVLIAVGIIAASVYYGQLTEMKHTNELTADALKKSDLAVNENISEMQLQADETSRLADNAKTQADLTKTIAEQAKTQAIQTTNLAGSTKDVAYQTVIQAKATNDLAGAAQKQLEVMRQEYETTYRPWVSMASGEVTFVSAQKWRGESYYTVQSRMTYRNTGNLPTTGVQVVTSIFLVNWAQANAKAVASSDEIQSRQRSFCEQQMPKQMSTITLIPGGVPQEYLPSFNVQLTDSGQLTLDGTNRITPVIIGCIFYTFRSSSTIHQSGFAYVVQKVGRDYIHWGESLSVADMALDDESYLTPAD